jgi:hypothetical protein
MVLHNDKASYSVRATSLVQGMGHPPLIRLLSINAAGADAVSRLELLEQMHSKRLITSEEFQQKRSGILKEL